ncbi:hypothetical protein XACJM35_1830001 [Xanthomonas citri pv. citri]|nr:hypothetical protein XAC902_910001 [Xanthomonas citri pv. citri]CEL48063.1 hypothetical protein XACJM35_1830001 [Xanthomonas citri pv. citri]
MQKNAAGIYRRLSNKSTLSHVRVSRRLSSGVRWTDICLGIYIRCTWSTIRKFHFVCEKYPDNSGASDDTPRVP